MLYGSAGCSTTGFDINAPATLYVLVVEGATKDFVGYGVTGDVYKRLSTHKRNMSSFGMCIVKEYIFPFSGNKAHQTEQAIKSAFPRNPQEIEGFKTEATFTQYLNPLLDFIKENR